MNTSRYLARASTMLAALLALLVATSAGAAQLRVHYDTGWGNAIAIRGDGGGLDWQSGQSATWTQGNVWVLNTPSTASSFEFKPLINDTTWSQGANYVAPAGNSTIDIYPFFGGQNGTLVTISGFYSSYLQNTRKLYIYLPPSYYENTAKRYPVLYMHDGQNLFDANAAFGGVEWQVDETLNQRIHQGTVREMIVVGIANNADRISEYTPTPDPDYGGGNGDAYLDFIEYEIIPYIDASYRTRTGPDNTSIAGSSLGGLISFYAGWTRSQVFGAAVCMSSSFWWNNESLTAEVASSSAMMAELVYIDAGGMNDGAADTEDMRDALQSIGYTHGVDLFHWYEPGGAHNEASWAARFHIPMESLFPFE